MRGWGLLAVLAALGACTTSDVFDCSGDETCGTDGRCEPTGYCSFPDDECLSGRRYGQYAPPQYARQCVEAEGAMGTGTGTSTGTSGATASSGGTTSPPTSTTNATEPNATGPETDTDATVPPPDGPHRIEIAIDSNQLSQPLTDFVIPVQLDETTINFEYAGPSGERLTFHKGDEQLAHELEVITDTKVLAWVRIPVLQPGGDVIELRVGDPGIMGASPGPELVWSDYIAVYHLTEPILSAAEPVADSGPRGIHAVANNLDEASNIEGFFGPGFLLDGALIDGDYIAVEDPRGHLVVDNGQALTIELWFKRETSDTSARTLVVRESCCLGYAVHIRNDFDRGRQFVRSMLGVGCCETTCCGGDMMDYRIAESDLPEGEQDLDWHGLITVLDRSDSNEVVAYLDGDRTGAESVPSVGAQTFGDLVIGADHQHLNTFNGVIDEIRFSDKPRDGEWALFHYQVMTGQHVAYGEPEPL